MGYPTLRGTRMTTGLDQRQTAQEPNPMLVDRTARALPSSTACLANPPEPVRGEGSSA